MMKRIGFLVGILLLISCSKDKEIKSNDDKIIVQYLTDNSISYTKVGGVYQYAIVSNPSGNDVGNVFSIYYTLKALSTGNVIDSHQASDGSPLLLLHNASAVFPIGLDQGLAGAKEGETIGIIVPGKLGYENYPTSAVPTDEILLFEVEIITRQSQSDIATSEDLAINNYITANDLNNTVTNPVDPVMAVAGGIYYKKTSNGDGMTPVSGDSITIDYAGRFLDGSGFDALAGFKYKYGVGEVLSGLESGIDQMEQAEQALLFLPSDKGYGASVRVLPDGAIDDLVTQLVIPVYVSKVPPFQVLIFDVTLQTIH
jgi:FKBP-type peptidyl-prolyl cis-trans isomerase